MEWDCVDLQCSHWDGDMCTLGGCVDPPTDIDEEYPRETPEEYNYYIAGEIAGDIIREGG